MSTREFWTRSYTFSFWSQFHFTCLAVNYPSELKYMIYGNDIPWTLSKKPFLLFVSNFHTNGTIEASVYTRKSRSTVTIWAVSPAWPHALKTEMRSRVSILALRSWSEKEPVSINCRFPAWTILFESVWRRGASDIYIRFAFTSLDYRLVGEDRKSLPSSWEINFSDIIN